MGFAVVREEQDRAMAGTDFGDEFREAAGVGEIDAGAGLAGVPVAAGDRRPPVRARQLDGGGVLLPAARGVQLEGVEPADTLAEQPTPARGSGPPRPHPPPARRGD